MIDLYSTGSNVPPMFDFSLNTINSQNRQGIIELTGFTLIGSTLVKCSNLINNGARLENISWRIMGKNLVLHLGKGLDKESKQTEELDGLKPFNVFKNSISGDQQKSKQETATGESADVTKITHKDYNCIASIITGPSLISDLQRTSFNRKASHEQSLVAPPVLLKKNSYKASSVNNSHPASFGNSYKSKPSSIKPNNNKSKFIKSHDIYGESRSFKDSKSVKPDTKPKDENTESRRYNSSNSLRDESDSNSKSDSIKAVDTKSEIYLFKDENLLKSFSPAKSTALNKIESDDDDESDSDVPKIERKDSFSERLAELKSQLGQDIKTEDSTTASKDADDVKKLDSHSVDSTKKLLKRQSSLFPAHKNYDPILYSDDSYSDDSISDDDDEEYDSDFEVEYKKGRRKNKSTSEEDEDASDDNDEWTDDDDEGVVNIRFTKQSDLTNSKPAVKKSLLSGLFLNEMSKEPENSSHSSATSRQYASHRSNSNASKISSGSNGSGGSGSKSKVVFSSSGGLQLRIDFPEEESKVPNTTSSSTELGSNSLEMDLSNSGLLKSKPSSSSLNTFASIQPVIQNATGVTTKPEQTTNKKATLATSSSTDLRETLRKNSQSSSTSSFTNLLPNVVPFQFFRNSNLENKKDESKLNNQLKMELLNKRSSNAPKTAKKLLNTAFSSHMFHQKLPENPESNNNESTAADQKSENKLQEDLVVKQSDIRSIVFGNFKGDGDYEPRHEEDLDAYEIDSYHNRGW